MSHDGEDNDEVGPVDLTPVWPGRDAPDRWATLVARIETAAAPELARRAAILTRAGDRLVDGVVAAVARFAAPAFIAAAAAIVIAVAASRQEAAPQSSSALVASSEALSEETVQQALRGSGEAWIAEQRAANADDLVQAMYDDGVGGSHE